MKVSLVRSVTQDRVGVFLWRRVDQGHEVGDPALITMRRVDEGQLGPSAESATFKCKPDELVEFARSLVSELVNIGLMRETPSDEEKRLLERHLSDVRSDVKNLFTTIEGITRVGGGNAAVDDLIKQRDDARRHCNRVVNRMADVVSQLDGLGFTIDAYDKITRKDA